MDFPSILEASWDSHWEWERSGSSYVQVVTSFAATVTYGHLGATVLDNPMNIGQNELFISCRQLFF